jgi:HSP20 family protein
MTALTRYHAPTGSLSQLLDEFFNGSTFSRYDRQLSTGTWPKVDIVEGDNEYTLRADLPGMAKDDIKVTVENGVLSITGEKKEEKQEKKKEQYSYFERSYGSFSRSFNLPEHVDAKNIDARYRNGVLELKLKKSEPAKPKPIEVKLG